MARIYGIKNPNPGKIQMFYAIDQSVGIGCANVRDDVLLVQFFLRVIFENDNEISNPFFTAGPKGPAIDGMWGPKSAGFLKAWEQHLQKVAPGVVKQDSRVDPIKSGSTVGSLTGSTYKICILNGRYGQLKGIPAHANISHDPLFPSALTQSLFVSVAG